MDLFLMVLRFLFGMPAEAGEVEPIVVHADGRTSNGRQCPATQRSIQNILGASPPRQRCLLSKPNSPGLWERLSNYCGNELRPRSRRQDKRRSSIN
jgi:hypothetical protein